MTTTTGAPVSLDGALHVTNQIRQAVERVIDGKTDVVKLAVTVLIAEGHILLEDVPGVGKTMLAKTLARATGSTVRRIQFTPDLLPSDVTGVTVYHQDRHDFEFKPGAVFANVVLGDEINRASPKTQSALLESMEERNVTVDGTTYALPRPFIVIATQNPVEMEGTYPLPEAQRDRFMARLSMGYPSASAELEMLDRHGEHDPLANLAPVCDADTVRQLTVAVRSIYASDAVKQYIIALIQATRTTPDLALGASPRASLHLLRAAKAHALIEGRNHILPDDVQALAAPVLVHRLIPSAEATMSQRTADDALQAILGQVAVPRARAAG